jgi:hypothetical protein
MNLDTGLTQGVSGMHLLPPGLANPSYSTGLPSGLEARQVPVGGASESDDDGSQQSLVFTAPGPSPNTPSDGRLTGALMFPASFLHSVLETAVLAHFEVGQAATSLSSDTIVLLPKQGLNGWQQLLLALRGLAYTPEAGDPWHRLGITPHAGQPPSLATIEQRYAVAETLLAAADGPQ